MRRRLLLALSLIAALATGAAAQPAGQPVSVDGGPLKELSTNVRAGSGPVHDSVGPNGGNAGTLGGKPVRGSATGDLRTGPVSEVTVGTVTADRAPAGTSRGQPVAAGVLDITRRAPGRGTQDDLQSLQQVLRSVQPLPRDARSPDEEAASTEAEDAGDAPSAATNDALSAAPAESAAGGTPDQGSVP